MRNANSAARLTRLFELYEQKMYRVAYAVLGDEGQAEDAVMAAFEGIVRTGRVPENPASKEAEWLACASVRNAAIDQYRRNARERAHTAPAAEDALAVAGSAAEEPEQAALAQAGFEAMVDSLKEPYREVLQERFGEDRSVRETASRLGISQANVRKRQQRAIAQIRNLRGIVHE